METATVPANIAEWLTVSEVARALGVSSSMAHKMSDDLVTFTVRSGRLYDPADVERMRRERETRKRNVS